MKINNVAWKKLATISFVFIAGVYSGRIIERIHQAPQSTQLITNTDKSQAEAEETTYYFATQERAILKFDENGEPIYSDWSPINDFKKVTNNTMAYANDTTKVYIKSNNSNELASELATGHSIRNGILYQGETAIQSLAEPNDFDKLKIAIDRQLVQYQERTWDTSKNDWSEWSERKFITQTTYLKNTDKKQYRIVFYTNQKDNQVNWFDLSQFENSSFKNCSLYEGETPVPMDMSNYNPDNSSHVSFDDVIYDDAKTYSVHH